MIEMCLIILILLIIMIKYMLLMTVSTKLKKSMAILDYET